MPILSVRLGTAKERTCEVLNMDIFHYFAWNIAITSVIFAAGPEAVVEVVNSAINKSAVQSDTLQGGQAVVSRWANDESALTCTESSLPSWTLYWKVDLDDILQVVGANVTLRWKSAGDHRKLLYRLDLGVGLENSSSPERCGSQTVTLDRLEDYQVEIICDHTTTGQFATLTATTNRKKNEPAGSPHLMLCDVKVFTLPIEISFHNSASAVDPQSADAIDDPRETFMEDDARTRSDRLLFLSEVAKSNGTVTEPQGYFTSPRKKIFRVNNTRTTRTRLERLLHQMQTPLTTTQASSTSSADNFSTFDIPLPSDMNDDRPVEPMVWKDELAAKLHAMQGYVAFTGIAVGILLTLALLAGVFILWSLTCKKSEGSAPVDSAVTHDFSFKAPSPSPPLPLRTLDRTSFVRVKEFPKDSVPKSRGTVFNHQTT